MWLATVAKGVLGFFGGSSGQKTLELADDLINTSEERSAQDSTDTASARAYNAPSHNSPFDILVDAFSRLIRPGVTLWLLGGFAGWWTLPAPNSIDPFYQTIFWIVITFWFGGRALMKDIPNFIGSIRKVFK